MILKRDKSRFLEIIASNIALISEWENILKIIMLTFFTSSIFVPVLNLLGMPIWLSIEKGMYDIYKNTNSKDEFVYKMKNLPILFFVRKYFLLFLGFAIGQTIYFILLSLSLMLYTSKGLNIGIWLFSVILTLYILITISGVGYLFNYKCKRIIQKCLNEGIKANFNLAYAFQKLSIVSLLKILIPLVIVNLFGIYLIGLFALTTISLIFYLLTSQSIELGILVSALSVFLIIFSAFLGVMVITFFIHISLFYISFKFIKK